MSQVRIRPLELDLRDRHWVVGAEHQQWSSARNQVDAAAGAASPTLETTAVPERPTTKMVSAAMRTGSTVAAASSSWPCLPSEH